MSEVVTDFVNKYVAEYGMLSSVAERPEPTENKPASATKAKRGKGSKEAS